MKLDSERENQLFQMQLQNVYGNPVYIPMYISQHHNTTARNEKLSFYLVAEACVGPLQLPR